MDDSHAVWFYAKDGQRLGPIPAAELRQKLVAGEVAQEDVVWTAGMEQWSAAGAVEALWNSSAAPAFGMSAPKRAARERREFIPPAATAAPAATTFSSAGAIVPAHASAPPAASSGAMPERASATLRMHTRPIGNVTDWPLDETRVEAFRQAVRIRRSVTAAAHLYRALLVLSLVGVCLFVLGMATSRVSSGLAVGLTIAVAIMLVFCALYWFAARATMRAQRWAPLTMGIIFSILALLQLAGGMFTISTRSSSEVDSNQMLGSAVSFVLLGAFAAVSWRSFAAIPKYLAQPAWCQELIVRAGL